ncbi:GxxExxY protein [Siphonobacter aquaeclarae]|uniref:GxxExxY protein n=1 Tax=Siphonobacter aquaeclarae TaxID=563176 RepID=A0A1G9SUT3_9BACT|nr:GxxExxY protein [Siphonobacter aquaeclarae]SDM39104.1 GxxExxY protein [Siphonobacter aquaeclarae]
MTVNQLSFLVRGAIFTVFRELGPGLFESVYQAALAYELRSKGLLVEEQKLIGVQYRGVVLDLGFKADLVVENQLIIEIKSVESIHNVHKKQLLTYLRLSRKRVGILVNFNAAAIIDKESLIRVVN